MIATIFFLGQLNFSLVLLKQWLLEMYKLERMCVGRPQSVLMHFLESSIVEIRVVLYSSSLSKRKLCFFIHYSYCITGEFGNEIQQIAKDFESKVGAFVLVIHKLIPP